METNTFEALCALASKEKWCRNIYCAAYSYNHFQYAVTELSKGESPESSGWLIHVENTYDELETTFGKLPLKGQVHLSKYLQNILTNAQIRNIIDHCKYPDWTGYLGIGLYYTQGVESYNRRLTNAWIPQIIGLLPPYASRGRNYFIGKLKSRSRYLHYKDLRLVEEYLRV